MDVILMASGGYFINCYWCLFYVLLLVPILLVDINGYYISGY